MMTNKELYVSGRRQEAEVCNVLGLELADEVHGCDAFDGDLKVEIKSSITKPNPGFDFQFGRSETEAEQAEHIRRKVQDWNYILCAFFDIDEEKALRWIVRVETDVFMSERFDTLMDYWRRGTEVHRSDPKTRTSLTKTWLKEYSNIVWEVEEGEFERTMFPKGAHNGMKWTPENRAKLIREIDGNMKKGMTKTRACDLVAKSSETLFGFECSGNALAKAYNGPTTKLKAASLPESTSLTPIDRLGFALRLLDFVDNS